MTGWRWQHNNREPKTRAALNGVPLVSAERASRALHRWGAMFPVIRPGTSGWVYVAWKRGGFVKVGWSRDPAARIAQVEDTFYLRGEAFPVVLVGPCHRKAEYVVLRALGDFRAPRPRFRDFPIHLHNEMFRPTREVLDLCAMLRAAAESCFFDNRRAGYESGPVKKCTGCHRGGHNASTCPALAQQRIAAQQAAAQKRSAA